MTHEEGLKKLVKLLEDAGVRKYTCINNWGYSQIERDIVELFLGKSPEKEIAEMYSQYKMFFPNKEMLFTDYLYVVNQEDISVAKLLQHQSTVTHYANKFNTSFEEMFAIIEKFNNI